MRTHAGSNPRRAMSLTVCAGLILASLSLARAEEITAADRSESIQGIADVALPVSWHTVDSGDYRFETDLENLYVALYNTVNLPLTLVDDPQLAAQPIVNLFRSEGIYFGRSFSVRLDALLCDLNPSVCKRERVPAGPEAIRSAIGHVGGYVASKGVWSQDGSVPLVVPAISFEVGAAIVEQAFRPELLQQDTIERQSTSAIDGVPSVDCSDWNRSCFEVVQRLNRVWFDPKRSDEAQGGTIKLPKTELIAELAIHELGSTGLPDKFSDARFTKQLVASNVSTSQQFSPAWQQTLRQLGAVELLTTTLADNITSVNSVRPQSSHVTGGTDAGPTDPGQVENPGVVVAALDPSDAELFDLINHPFKHPDQPFPDYLKRPVGITVFDFAFDSQHCGLVGHFDLDNSLWPSHQPQLDRERTTDCGAPSSEPANRAHDHGTHVSGIIASSFQGKGHVGLNPFAKLRYVPLDQPAMRDARYIQQIRKKIRDISLDQDLETTGIVNISWKYQPNFNGPDAIRQSIRENDEVMLFVVAAGNDGQNYSAYCPDQPACFYAFDNVLTVVGLDRDHDRPGVWVASGEGGSNTNPEFGIGAIASDITSTVFGGYTAPMSGTSQAAPQVAAAASLVQSRFEAQFSVEQPRLLPIRIKNRLIYTSDLFPSINGKLKGGRLNVSRALDMARAHLTLEREGGLEHHPGNLLDVPSMGANPYIECLTGPQGDVLQIRLRHLRRLEYDSARRKHVVIYQAQGESRDSPLIRVNDCRLTTRYNVATFDSDQANGQLSFQLRDIRSYVSPMF